MRRIAVIFLCSLFLAAASVAMCTVPCVYAGPLSEDESSESIGQTIVKAKVEPKNEPADSTSDTPSDGGQGNSDTGETKDTSVNRFIWSIKTGDFDTQITLLFLMLMGSILLVAERIRRLYRGA